MNDLIGLRSAGAFRATALYPGGIHLPFPCTDGGYPMALALGDTAPDFEAETTEGRIKFHDWIGDKWAVCMAAP
jgi:hypothetical protein